MVKSLNIIIKLYKLFIDSTFINNKYGVEDIGLNIDNKKKRASKLSIICNENKFIFSIISVKLNKNNKNKYNGFKHDVNTIQDSLNNINRRILKKRIYIENAISIIKKDERVMTRKDHNIKSYLGFVYLTCLNNNIKILNKIL